VAKKAAAPKPAKAAQPVKPPKTELAPHASPEAKALARIQNGLIKMGSNAPQKVKPFLRHVGALLGKDSTASRSTPWWRSWRRQAQCGSSGMR
jgi:hypothetical protein